MLWVYCCGFVFVTTIFSEICHFLSAIEQKYALSRYKVRRSMSIRERIFFRYTCDKLCPLLQYLKYQKFSSFGTSDILNNMLDTIFGVTVGESQPDFLGSYSFDGKPTDLCERLRAPVDNLYFAGEATSIDHSGSGHGAYSSGIKAAAECQRRLVVQYGLSDHRFKIVLRDEMATEVMVSLQISRM